MKDCIHDWEYEVRRVKPKKYVKVYKCKKCGKTERKIIVLAMGGI